MVPPPPPVPEADLWSQSLVLLRQPAPSRDILRPEFYRRTSLLTDLGVLCEPEGELTPELVLNVVAKYFYAYLNPASARHALPLRELTRLFELFAVHRDADRPAIDTGLLREMRAWSFALRMLADLPKTAQIFLSIAGAPLPARAMEHPYQGLDIGTGSGILMLAQYVQARRNGFSVPFCLGLEVDPRVGERTCQVMEMLGVGPVVTGNALDGKIYDALRPGPLTYVCNETVAAMHERLGREDFTGINKVLFSRLGERLEHTRFFPEALVVFAPTRKLSVILTRRNGFQIPDAYRGLSLYPQGIVMDGSIVVLNRLGEVYTDLIPVRSRRLLQRRW